MKLPTTRHEKKSSWKNVANDSPYQKTEYCVKRYRVCRRFNSVAAAHVSTQDDIEPTVGWDGWFWKQHRSTELVAWRFPHRQMVFSECWPYENLGLISKLGCPGTVSSDQWLGSMS